MVAPVSRIDPSSDDSCRSSGIRKVGMLFVCSVTFFYIIVSNNSE